ncbi:MAG: hypothetical protein V7727_16250 [Sneathiella sp.]
MLKFLTRLSLSLLCSLLIPAVGYSAENDVTLRVVAFRIVNVLEQDGSGDYNEILKELTFKTGIKFQLEVLPIARARAAYKLGQYDCLLPLDRVFEMKHLDHVQSVAFYKAKLYAFTQNGVAPIQTIESLNGLRVGGELGIPFTPRITKIVGTNRATNLKELIRMLERGRFDAIIAYTPDILEIFDEMHVVPLSYDPETPLAIYNDALTCRPTERNIALLKKINLSLIEMGY